MNKVTITLCAVLASAIILGGLMTYLPADSAATEEAAAPEMEKYVNEDKKYSIEYPKGWEKQNWPNLDLVLLSPSPIDPGTQTHATMNVISQHVGDAVTLEQFFNESLKHLNSALKDVQVDQTGDQNLNGTPSKWAVYSHKIAEIPMRVIQYFIVADGNMYLLTFSANGNDFDHYRPTFESIASSFRLLKGK